MAAHAAVMLMAQRHALPRLGADCVKPRSVVTVGMTSKPPDAARLGSG